MPHVSDMSRGHRPAALRAKLAAGAQRQSREAAAKSNRRRAAAPLLRPGVKLAAALLFVFTLSGGGLHLWHSGWVQAQWQALVDGTFHLTARAGLQVEDIMVDGRGQTDRQDILTALGVGRGDAILNFSPVAARTALEALPWVKNAVVERQLPNKVYVRLIERHPMALWQHDHRLFLIDGDGNVLAEQGKNDELGPYRTLPMLVGADAPGQGKALLGWLKDVPSIASRVDAAVWVGDRRWDLKLNNGVTVRLPENDVPAALAQLVDLEAKTPVLDRDITAIDLRLPDRLVVQTANHGAPPPAPSERRHNPQEKI